MQVFFLNIFIMTNLVLAIEQRKLFRASITRMHNECENFQSYSEIKKLQTKLKLDGIEKDLDVVNNKILELKFMDSTDGIQDELGKCEEYKDKLIQCKAVLDHVPPQESQPLGREATSGRAPPRSLLKSPTAPLPNFTSAVGENLELFLNQFEETLSKFSYTDYDKLLLLKQQITGKASLLIDSLESEKQTYTDAKNLLMSALASTEIQKFNILKQLSDMKLSHTGEPFQYIADMRKVMQAFKSLDVTINDVLQFFFFTGMNESFKNQLTLVTQSLRPTLDQIIDNFFVANERYESAKKYSKHSKNVGYREETETISLATGSKIPKSVSNPFENCTLCGNNMNNHPINKCMAYPNPADKLNKLKMLKGCTKCGNVDHWSEKCNFRFRKSCTSCNKWHFSFLCPDTGKSESYTKKPKMPGNFRNSRDRMEKPNSRETNCNMVSSSFFFRRMLK